MTTDAGHVASSGQAVGPVQQVLAVPLRRGVAGPVRRMEGEPVRQSEDGLGRAAAAAVVARKGEFLRKATCRCELYRLMDGHKCRQGVARSLRTIACVVTGSIQTGKRKDIPPPLNR